MNRMAVASSKPASSSPLVKNVAAAPFVYFDAAPVFGFQNGMIEVALTARALTLKADGMSGGDIVAIAHLRSSAAAAAGLRDALTKALEMMETTPIKSGDLN